MAKKKRIDRNGYIAVVDASELAKATVESYVYEHRQVAEAMLDRPLREGEEVHHLDLNKKNNSPENLLVLSGPMHAKLHAWLAKNTIVPIPEYSERIKLGCIRCAVCETPINHDEKYCSPTCQNVGRRKTTWPNKEELAVAVEKRSFVDIGKEYGVSDNTVRKWCKTYGIK